MIRDNKFLCYNGSEECLCKPTLNSPLVSTPTSSSDLAAVLVLPDQWIPRRCGSTLTNYLEEQKKSYDGKLNDLSEQAALVNKNINYKVRELAEILLISIRGNQKEMNCVVENCQKNDIPLDIKKRKMALEQIRDLSSQRVQDILRYKKEAQELEKKRADDLKNVLQRNFQECVAVGHFSPKYVLHDFDERIFGVNQQLLSNYRAYVDLVAFLRTQLNGDLVCIRSSINQLCLVSLNSFRRQSALPWTSRLFGKRSSTTVIRDNKTPTNMDSLHRVTLDLGQYQTCVNNLVEAYREAIINVFDDFVFHLGELQNHINNKLFYDIKHSALYDMEAMSQKGMHRISDSGLQLTNFSNREMFGVTKNGLINIQETFHMLGNRLRHTYSVLHDASNLLKPHMFRFGLAQKLTVTVLEDMQTNFDIFEMANEIPYNISLDQMRNASDVDKLQHEYDNILAFLEKTFDTFSHRSESESSKVEDFMNLLPSLANTLLSEYNCFLENNPKIAHLHSGSFTSTGSVAVEDPMGVLSMRSQLPNVSMQSKLHVMTLTNWLNGFLESLEHNVRFVPDQISHIARKWVDEKIVLINLRYSLKLISHSVRFQRVKAARDTRLAEIRMHETRLSEHLDAVNYVIDTLPLQASEFLALDAKELYPLSAWIVDIQRKFDDLFLINPVDMEVRQMKMSSYAARLRKHYQLFHDSLDAAIEQYKKKLESRIQLVRISNVQFLSQLTLFNEQGRYSAAEALKTCTILVKTGEAVEDCSKRTFEALNHRRIQLLGFAEQLLLPLQNAVENVVKGSGKFQAEGKRSVKRK